MELWSLAEEEEDGSHSAPRAGGSAGVEVGMQEPQSLRTNHEMEGGAGGAV